MKQKAMVPTNEVRFVPVMQDYSHVGLVESETAVGRLMAEGWQIVNVLQATATAPAVVILCRPNGAIALEVDVDVPAVSAVSLTPAGGSGPPRGFRGFEG